jgi:tetratricopeptide (TPR) repeat protein
MNKHRSRHNAGFVSLSLIAFAIALLGFSGCKTDVVHQRSISELNEKAQSMMQSGDYDGAISRLEAAHDLEPNEPNTTYNLAVAYQSKGEYGKAIAIFDELLQHPGPDNSPMSSAQIHKNMGITYEAQADKLEAEASTEADNPKGDKAKAEALKQESRSAMDQALRHYRKALPGLKDSEGIAAQIQAIENKLKKSDADAQP